MASPYKLGEVARLSDSPEPFCPFCPGSDDYKQFAEGFCNAKPLPFEHDPHKLPPYVTK